ncbi:MAG: GntR family transcriptional regulator [Treponema sp.]|jgi:DNA-binding GntR family transcriptional regulator|nr:GntR family transcriptional regulator [Treponema sp.]
MKADIKAKNPVRLLYASGRQLSGCLQQPGSVQDLVYTALRKSIINLNLAPGTAVSEKEIARLYQVSRTPVREAFIHLSREGLVQVIPQKGTLVSLIDLCRVNQEFFLRENLELAVQAPFLRNSRAGHFARLEKLVETQAEDLAQGKYIEFINHDDAFHHIFFNAAGQELSWKVLETLCGHYHRVRLLTAWFQDIAQDIIHQHGSLLKALREKDLEAARELLKKHLNQLRFEEPRLKEKFPRYFSVPGEQNSFEIDFGGIPLLEALGLRNLTS